MGGARRIGKRPQPALGAFHDQRDHRLLDRLLQREFGRLVDRLAQLGLEQLLEIDELEDVALRAGRRDALAHHHRGEDFAGAGRNRAQIDGDGILLVFDVGPDAEKLGPRTAGNGVAVEAYNPAFEDHPGIEHRGQDFGIDAFFAEILRTHLADDLALLEQVVEVLALDHREPAALPGILHRLDQDRGPALTDRARQALPAFAGLELAGLVGETINRHRDRLRRQRQVRQRGLGLGHRAEFGRAMAEQWLRGRHAGGKRKARHKGEREWGNAHAQRPGTGVGRSVGISILVVVPVEASMIVNVTESSPCE